LEDADGHGCWLSSVKFEGSQQPTRKTEVGVDLLAEILYGKEKLYPSTPLSRIANVPERKISFIQVSNLGGNPFRCIICGISSCSTLSKVFFKIKLKNDQFFHLGWFNVL
jgi:hypothetical protein